MFAAYGSVKISADTQSDTGLYTLIFYVVPLHSMLQIRSLSLGYYLQN